MHKILLISDTHGQIDLINERASDTKADFVIHAGDFGFYDDESVVRLNPRELHLLIKHSAVAGKYPNSKDMDREELATVVRNEKLLGEFPNYLSGQKRFEVPVYAVWGNHEDVKILRDMERGLTVPNLHILDENHTFEFQDDDNFAFSLFGLGGNFLVKRLFDRPIAGDAGKVWATLHQFGVLYKKVMHNKKPSIFVSHVSPGKEPLLTSLVAHLLPSFWISGHMGPPFTCVWNQFTIRESDDVQNWLQSELAEIEQYSKFRKLSEEAALALELIKNPPESDQWFRNMWNINLPDAKDGHAVLTVDKGRFSLETYSKGITLKS
jgi:predicted phosphodiesterase